MPQYIIEREIPGASTLTKEELADLAVSPTSTWRWSLRSLSAKSRWRWLTRISGTPRRLPGVSSLSPHAPRWTGSSRKERVCSIKRE